MKRSLLVLPVMGLFMLMADAKAQVGVGTTTPNASSMLEIQSTTKGLLPPRMTSAQRTAIATPATGLIVYQTDGTSGYYHYTGSAWAKLVTSSDAVTLSSGYAANTSSSVIAVILGGTDIPGDTTEPEREEPFSIILEFINKAAAVLIL
nr:hypothetical protein [Pedobacter sp. ASV28]